MIIFALLFGFLLFSSSYAQEQSCDCDEPLEIGTFNTYLIFLSAEKEDRLDAQINYFQNDIDLDILCLQELWDPDRRREYINRLETTYPYSYFAPRQNVSGDDESCSLGCSDEDLEDLLDCLDITECFGENIFDGDFFDCLEENCEQEYDSLPNNCKACLSFSEENSFSDRIDACLNVDENQQFQCTEFFDGWPDVVILSKYEFTDTDYLVYDESPLAPWAVVYANVDVPNNWGNLHVFCTHLVAEQPVIDNEEENEAQIRQLMDFVDSTVQDDSPIVIMGDFNTGPEIGDNSGAWESNYRILYNSDWRNLYLTAEKEECSRCEDNFWSVSESTLIDHIFVDQFENLCLIEAERFATEDLVDIGDEEVPLSDHYGIRATICEDENNFGPQRDIDFDDDNATESFKMNWIACFVMIALLMIFI